MKMRRGIDFLIHKAKRALDGEADLQATLSAAKTMGGDVWQTVRLLVATARCTLEAGRGALALPILMAAFEMVPEPFRQLAFLQQRAKENYSSVYDLSLIAEAVQQSRDKTIPSVVSTALIVWHGAVSSTAVGDSCTGSFLCFSHNVAQLIVVLIGADSTYDDVSMCWLYNILAFAYRCKSTKMVSLYLLNEVREEIQVPSELFEGGSQTLSPCFPRPSGAAKGLILRGLGQAIALSAWSRLCAKLFSEGCGQLWVMHEEISRQALDSVNILQRVLTHESRLNMKDFGEVPCATPEEAGLLCRFAVETHLCLSRAAFSCARIACFLKRVADVSGSQSSSALLSGALSSLAALALQHRHIDIALEFIQVSTTVTEVAESGAVIWGNELLSIIKDVMKLSDGPLPAGNSDKHTTGLVFKDVSTPLRAAKGKRPAALLHEVVEESCTAGDVVRIMATSRSITDLLPVGMAVLRGKKSFRQQLLSDKIAPLVLLDGLSILITLLVDEGDLPLARAFFPLLINLCIRLPSQANLVMVLRAIGTFAHCRADDSEEWGGVATALSPLLPCRCKAQAPPYMHTRTQIVGRTFTTRRSVFDALDSHKSIPGSSVHPYCQVQVLFVGGKKGIRLKRASSVPHLEWEKELTIGEALTRLVNVMQDIEIKNRQHLDVVRKKEESLPTPLPSQHPQHCTLVDIESEICSARTGEGSAKCIASERADWWERRRALDAALADVVKSLESDGVFGDWRLAMCGDPPRSSLAAVQKAATRLLEALDAPVEYEADVAILLAGLPFMARRCIANDALPFNPSHAINPEVCTQCNEVLHELSSALERALLDCNIAKPFGLLFTVCRDVCSLVLSILCSTLSPTTQRNQSPPTQSYARSPDHMNLFDVERTPVYLVLDSELHCLPFEAIDVLRYGSVARVPTASFVTSFDSSRLDRSNSFNSRHEGVFNIPEDSVYCVVDPNGVMPKTAKRLVPVCQRSGWRVISGGTLPSPLLHDLYASNAQLYIYVGHGKGEQLIHREELYERFPDYEHFPAVFLMGCSSARMEGGSTHDCYGMPYAFLHAGCPLLVGCLWHVTDGEIDRLTKRLLTLIASGGEDGRPLRVGEALRIARRACKLPFLTGYATVLYGMNLLLNSKPLGG
ncbi:separase [Trypanosoma vivax]|nr:separase [Trypanosoma vivax]